MSESKRVKRIPGMPIVVVAPDIPCEDCKWDRIALAIAKAAGKPEEFVKGCKKH